MALPVRAQPRVPATSSAALERLRALVAAAGPPVESVVIPEARSFCGSPYERSVRAQLGASLPACDAPGARLTVRAVDRTLDRLDAEWRETTTQGEITRREAWIFTAGEVLAPAALARRLADVPRSPQDAVRALLLATLEPGCSLALDQAPAGLGAAWEVVSVGVHGTAARGYRALAWSVCPSEGGAESVEYRLRAVEPTPARRTQVRELVRFCRGRAGCQAPP
jgi:hypothetical protein